MISRVFLRYIEIVTENLNAWNILKTYTDCKEFFFFSKNIIEIHYMLFLLILGNEGLGGKSRWLAKRKFLVIQCSNIQ